MNSCAAVERVESDWKKESVGQQQELHIESMSGLPVQSQRPRVYNAYIYPLRSRQKPTEYMNADRYPVGGDSGVHRRERRPEW
jgi:hypothetical protein